MHTARLSFVLCQHPRRARVFFLLVFCADSGCVLLAASALAYTRDAGLTPTANHASGCVRGWCPVRDLRTLWAGKMEVGRGRIPGEKENMIESQQFTCTFIMACKFINISC